MCDKKFHAVLCPPPSHQILATPLHRIKMFYFGCECTFHRDVFYGCTLRRGAFVEVCTKVLGATSSESFLAVACYYDLAICSRLSFWFSVDFLHGWSLFLCCLFDANTLRRTTRASVMLMPPHMRCFFCLAVNCRGVFCVIWPRDIGCVITICMFFFPVSFIWFSSVIPVTSMQCVRLIL